MLFSYISMFFMQLVGKMIDTRANGDTVSWVMQRRAKVDNHMRHNLHFESPASAHRFSFCLHVFAK